MKRFEDHVLHINGRKANWIGHTVSRNCLLKHVTEGIDGDTTAKTLVAIG
jgi:hypothetical protein